MHNHWREFVYFFIGVIIPTYNLFEWISSHFGKLFLKTEREAAFYIHAKMHAAKLGHSAKDAYICEEDDCKDI